MFYTNSPNYFPSENPSGNSSGYIPVPSGGTPSGGGVPSGGVPSGDVARDGGVGLASYAYGASYVISRREAPAVL